MSTVASDLAVELLTQLGEEFTVPAVNLSDADFALPVPLGNDLYAAVPQQSIEELTVGTVDGTGAFDKIMSSTRAHLKEQYDSGLISGDVYTKAYIELTTAAMASGLQFLVQGREGYWGAVLLQQQAQKAEVDTVRAKIELETAKQQLAAAVAQTKVLETQHVLTKMQVANEDAKYVLVQAQVSLVNEQQEAQRGQTVDTRSDGVTPVTGMIGKQKDLYTQQVTSYQRDAETKVGKMYLDAWITQKTLDEGLLAPTELQNAGVDTVLANIRAANGLT